MRSLAQLAILFALLLPISKTATAETIPLNEGIPTALLSRVFPIQTMSRIGTCFVIDVDERQYVVTARHIVPTIRAAATVSVFYQDAWHPLLSKPILPENENIDAVALAVPAETLADLKLGKLTIPVGSTGVVLGQKVFFLGFPFGLASRSKDRNDLIPFVKSGILSAIDNRTGTAPVVYIDGHNNKGFSGGPVVFANLNSSRQLQILGVISAYKPQRTDVIDVSVSDEQPPEGKVNKLQYVLENSGIAMAYQLNELVEAIRKPPKP